jgi:uncharacterized protein (TIGR00297 family)
MSALHNATLLRLLVGLAAATVIATIARRRGALTSGGALGAVVVGTITFGLGGWAWGVVLVAFFALSTLLSRYRRRDKKVVSDKFQKGGQRDLAQVLANGGLAAALAVLFYLRPGPAVLAAFLGAMATVTADTWGTELGILSPFPPRLITTARRVPPGTSGGVSLAGTAASTMGALFIGLLAFVLLSVGTLAQGGRAVPLSWIIPSTAISGLLGSLFDSLLGATVQGIYYCARCEEETEKPQHGCGLRTAHLRGLRWLDNDAVNFISSLCGALIAMALWGVLRR